MRMFIAFMWVMISMCTSVYAQSSKREPGGSTPEADSLLTDTFSGLIPFKKHRDPARLILKHCRYCDEGTFAIVASPRVTFTCTSFKFSGKWTVLRGSATDDNATVVEIDAPAPIGLLYYLRLKNGNLQQLDSLLREIKPIKNYMLLKQ